MKEKLRIRTQILLLFIIISAIASAVMIGAIIILYGFVKSDFTQYSNEILALETNRQLTTYIEWYELRLKTILGQIFLKQSIFRRIYIFADTNQITVPDAFVCPTNIDQVASISIFCIQVQNQSLELVPQKQIRFSSLFQESLMIFDNSQFIATGIAYTTNDALSILGTWPALNYSSTYDAHKRAWYLNHINNMRNGYPHQYSDLFTTTFGSYTIAVSSNITGSSQQYEGVVFDLLNFNNFNNNFRSDYMLINQKGQIILGEVAYPENTTTSAYFYQTNITGFNETDFEYIKLVVENSSQAQDYSTCKQIISDYLCLYNSLYQQDVLILSKQLEYPPYPPYLMIVLKNMTFLEQQVEEQHQIIYSLILNQFDISIAIFLASCFISTIVFLCILKLITNPLNLLINYSNLRTHQQLSNYILFSKNIHLFKVFKEFSKKIIVQTNKKSNAIKQLTDSFLILINRLENTSGQNKKNQQCLNIEEFSYPQQKEQKRLIKKIYSQLQYII